MSDEVKRDLHESDIAKDGTFVDENGVKQLAVPLSSIFNMVDGKSKGSTKKPAENNPPAVRRPKRGIKK